MNQEINFDTLAKALETFKEAIEKENPSQLERDGIIQRFEYTFEVPSLFSEMLTKKT